LTSSALAFASKDSVKIPASSGPELLELSKRSIRGFREHDMSTYAAALAYRALFAIVPFLAFLVVLLGFLGISGVFDWSIDQTRSVLQEQSAGVGEQLIRQIQDQAGSELLLSMVVLAIWSVSRGVKSLTKALNVIYGVSESRPAWKKAVLPFLYALGLVLTTVLASALLLIGPDVVKWIVGLVGLDEVFIALWAWLRLPVALVLLMLTVSVVYWAIPNVDHPYRLITPGAALAVIVWVLASLGFSFYLATFADYSVTYGSLGAAIALLLYFYISAAVLLLGAEVNAAIHHCAQEERKTGHETLDTEHRSRKDV
jgi:membrane protein